MENRTKNIGEGVPANHGARAVDITTCLQPLGDNGEASKTRALAAVAGSRGRSSEPMAYEHRLDIYCAQVTRRLTPNQMRRLAKKYHANGGA